MESFDIAGNAKIVSEIDRRPLVSFSCGVDSIAMWLRLKELNDKHHVFDMDHAVFFYMYFIPDLPFVEDYLQYFEEREGVTIARVPHNLFLESMANWHWQTPSRSKAIETMQRSKGAFVQMTKEQIEEYIKGSMGYLQDAYTCIGVKAGDSAMRRMAMRKTQGLNQTKRKFYAIADYENRDVYDIIKRHGIKVPVDYRLFGISYENLQYRFAKIISEQCPVSWEMCKEWFPMIELSLARYERYHPEWTGDNMFKGCKGKFFADMILEPRVAI
jgi:3'-phosphoadenosine 5'-phosphosulfate sulfotransferase (PAPS reductase)/FAD synthetase